MQLIAEMQEYYHKRAAVYDASMGYDQHATLERLAPVVAAMRQLLHDRTVLEIACGPAFWTSQIAPVAKSVLATDYNTSTLAEARRKPLDWAKVTLQQADAYCLPDFPIAFEAAMAVDWFSHVPRSRFDSFLRGLHQRLAPGALVVFNDQLPRVGSLDQLPRAGSLTELRDTEGNHLQERTLPDGSRYRVIKHFLSDAELRSLLSPYAAELRLERFPACGRIVVSYRLPELHTRPGFRRHI